MTSPDRVSTGRSWAAAFSFGPLTTGNGVAPAAGDNFVTGWSLWETTGAAGAVLDIFDGNDANGQRVARVTLSAGQSTRDTTGAAGLWFRTGIFVQCVSGSVAGSMWSVDA